MPRRPRAGTSGSPVIQRKRGRNFTPQQLVSGPSPVDVTENEDGLPNTLTRSSAATVREFAEESVHRVARVENDEIKERSDASLSVETEEELINSVRWDIYKAKESLQELNAEVAEHNEAKERLNELLHRSKTSRASKKEIIDTSRTRNTTEVLHLNVGGELFVVSICTLLQRDSQSYFHSLVAANTSPTIPCFKDESGAIFIDRDPVVFRYILSYLRGSNNFHMLDEDEMERLKIDARYFNLGGLLGLFQEKLGDPLLRFNPGPGVSPDRKRLRVVYGVSLVGDTFLITGRHRITFEVKSAEYVGIGIASESCLNTDQEFHKTANCCVYYMTGVFYANFQHHRKEENLQKIENDDFVSVTLDMGKRYAEYRLKNFSKMVHLGRASRLRFAVAMKLGSRVRIVPEEEAALLPINADVRERQVEGVPQRNPHVNPVPSTADDFTHPSQGAEGLADAPPAISL